MVFPNSALWEIVEAAVILGGALSAIEILLRVVKRYLKRYGKQTGAIADEGLIPAMRPFLYGIALLAGAIFLSTRLVGPEVSVYMNAVAILIGGSLIYKLVGRVLNIMGTKVSQAMGSGVHGGIYVPLAKGVRALVIIIVFFTLLAIFKIDLEPLIFGWGFGLFIFALAIQGFLGDIVAGWYILLSRPFKIDDVIQLPSGEVCRVVDIKGQRSALRNVVTGDSMDISNLDLLKAKIVHYGSLEGDITLHLNVGIQNAKDIQKAKEVVSAVAGNNSYVSRKSPFKVNLLELGEGVAKFEVILHLRNLSKRREALDAFNVNVAERLEKANIKIM